MPFAVASVSDDRHPSSDRPVQPQQRDRPGPDHRAIAQVNGGLSVTIAYPYGDDWAAEDAAVGNFGDDDPGGDVKTPRSSPTTTTVE